jgi:DNA-binding response OmpR family regulator
MMQDGEWDVVGASSADEALLCAKQERPDLVLLDWMMPRVDGQTALAMLRAEPHTARVPVVVMTALGAAERTSSAMLGLADIIAKPFDPLTLPARMMRVLQREGTGHRGNKDPQAVRPDAQGQR